jgi:hypothetical protein
VTAPLSAERLEAIRAHLANPNNDLWGPWARELLAEVERQQELIASERKRALDAETMVVHLTRRLEKS